MIASVNDETLVARRVVIVRQQAPDEARDFDPLAFISLCECSAHKKSTVGRPWPPCFLVFCCELALGDRHHRDFHAAVRLAARF